MPMFNPRYLCTENGHLQGAHGEIHKHRHNFVKKHSISGRVRSGDVQIEPLSMKSYHDQLEIEINRRQLETGRKLTQSPYEMPDLSYLPKYEREAKVNIEQSLNLYMYRCVYCKERIKKYGFDKHE